MTASAENGNFVIDPDSLEVRSTPLHPLAGGSFKLEGALLVGAATSGEGVPGMDAAADSGRIAVQHDIVLSEVA